MRPGGLHRASALLATTACASPRLAFWHALTSLGSCCLNLKQSDVVLLAIFLPVRVTQRQILTCSSGLCGQGNSVGGDPSYSTERFFDC